MPINPLTEASWAERKEHARQIDAAIDKRIADGIEHLDIYSRRMIELTSILTQRGCDYQAAAEGSRYLLDNAVEAAAFSIASEVYGKPMDISGPIKIDARLRAKLLGSPEIIPTCVSFLNALLAQRDQRRRDEAAGTVERSNPKLSRTEPYLPQIANTFGGLPK